MPKSEASWSNKETSRDNLLVIREGDDVVVRSCSPERNRVRRGDAENNSVIGRFHSIEEVFNTLFSK